MRFLFWLAAAALLAPTPAVPSEPTPAGTWDVLEEVNQLRRWRGLPPFLWDRELTLAAGSASEWRAARLCAGHTPNDFLHLPRGSCADVAGCAAWGPPLGWGACATFEPGSHRAGAAYTLGRDGKRYMHLFVRRAAPGAPRGEPSGPVLGWR